MSPHAGLETSTVTAGAGSSPTLRRILKVHRAALGVHQAKCTFEDVEGCASQYGDMVQVVAAIIERDGRF